MSSDSAASIADRVYGRFRKPVRPADRLGDNRVDHAQALQILAVRRSACAAVAACAPSRQRMEAQPSGEMTE